MNLNQIPLLRFLREEAPQTLRFIVLMSTLSGAAGGAILATVNAAAAAAGVDGGTADQKHRLLLLFVITLITLVVSKWFSLVRSAEVVESMLTNLRVRICNKIRQTEFETIEQLNESEIFTAIARDTSMISQSVRLFANVCQQALLLVAGLVYLAWISQTALLLFVLIGSAAGWYYWIHLGELRETSDRDFGKQAEFFSYLSHLLEGFKELALSRRKSDEMFEDMKSVAQEARGLSIQSSLILARALLFSDVALYLLLGTIVFILPQLSATYSETLVKSTIAVMFVFGPLGTVVGTLPVLSNADAALNNIYRLENKLEVNLAERVSAEGHSGQFEEFQTIRCESLAYEYTGRDGSSSFTFGPVSLDVRRGEVLFIVGGNGSGKTTLLKLLTGLYCPVSGQIRVDECSVAQQNRQAYRELFAGVFSNFHLFDRLYGVGEICEATARDLLNTMEIAHKVTIRDGQFSTLNLSTGQRKRLALIASLLENRAIYVFDEWSADQDPQFRECFYRKIIPKLRDEGKTIIAITHDDRYWHTADRLVKLDYGKVQSIEIPTPSVAPSQAPTLMS